MGRPAAQPLRAGDHIRLDAVVLIAIQLARAPHAGLHLVHHEQDIALLAERRQRLDKSLVQRADAAFALDQLDHHRAGVLVNLCLDALQVGIGVGKALGKGGEVLMEPRLPGRGQRRHRAAMERIVQGHNPVAALPMRLDAVLARQLDRALVGLRAGVCKEDPWRSPSVCRGFPPAGSSRDCNKGWKYVGAPPPGRTPLRPSPGRSSPTHSHRFPRQSQYMAFLPYPQPWPLCRSPARPGTAHRWASDTTVPVA